MSLRKLGFFLSFLMFNVLSVSFGFLFVCSYSLVCWRLSSDTFFEAVCHILERGPERLAISSVFAGGYRVTEWKPSFVREPPNVRIWVSVPWAVRFLWTGLVRSPTVLLQYSCWYSQCKVWGSQSQVPSPVPGDAPVSGASQDGTDPCLGYMLHLKDTCRWVLLEISLMTSRATAVPVTHPSRP